MAEKETWGEYSRLVLKELETLGAGIANLNTELQGIKQEIALLKDREDKVEKLSAWKDKVSEVISPTQLEDLVSDVKDLNSFKTRAITVFIVIQTLFAVSMALLNYFND